MAECATCGDDVPQLFEHRVRSETMTHQRTKRSCADCHPSLPSTSKRLVTDGGTTTSACPTCSGPTVDTDGPLTCVDCGWTPREYHARFSLSWSERL
ncbi:hypothetical protein B2G88_08315 [Natronolimnobius baerhuensis]|uniref:Uncharacterized protein n=1 Tax=Natronolimnobius baerhuensis TaxID=253108 RepID=A0A202E817_9EURY|nr:hypothetical protein B2G88_08315 [Natronolimnobius baerhuensis]